MAIDQIKKLELERLKLFNSALKIMPNSIKQLKIRNEITEIDKKINSLKNKNMAKFKTATKTARKATATKKAKSKPTQDTGVLKYSKRLGNGKYEYKYVKKR